MSGSCDASYCCPRRGYGAIEHWALGAIQVHSRFKHKLAMQAMQHSRGLEASWAWAFETRGLKFRAPSLYSLGFMALGVGG